MEGRAENQICESTQNGQNSNHALLEKKGSIFLLFEIYDRPWKKISSCRF